MAMDGDEQSVNPGACCVFEKRCGMSESFAEWLHTAPLSAPLCTHTRNSGALFGEGRSSAGTRLYFVWDNYNNTMGAAAKGERTP